ncbi:MAG: nucleotidyltransferase family protein [Planctomycetota bacterium]
MVAQQLVEHRRGDILRLAAQHGATNVRVFGSVVRGEAGAGSDIDFLVDMEPKRSLLDIATLKLDLQDLLGCDVDVVTESSLYWLLRRRILREARPL